MRGIPKVTGDPVHPLMKAVLGILIFVFVLMIVSVFLSI